MRAEIQTIVADIDKSLSLLAQRMDHETAAHRLEEFNARVEAPNLWDDADAAQKLMRDRQSLVDAMENYDAIRQELSDHQTLLCEITSGLPAIQTNLPWANDSLSLFVTAVYMSNIIPCSIYGCDAFHTLCQRQLVV